MSALVEAGVVAEVLMGAGAALMVGRLRRRWRVELWGLGGVGGVGLVAVVKGDLLAVGCVGVSLLGRNGTPCWSGRVATWLMIVATVGEEGLVGVGVPDGRGDPRTLSHNLVVLSSIFVAKGKSKPFSCCVMTASSCAGSEGCRAETVGFGELSAGGVTWSRRCRS